MKDYYNTEILCTYEELEDEDLQDERIKFNFARYSN